jgi:hypothetical protein
VGWGGVGCGWGGVGWGGRLGVGGGRRGGARGWGRWSVRGAAQVGEGAAAGAHLAVAARVPHREAQRLLLDGLQHHRRRPPPLAEDLGARRGVAGAGGSGRRPAGGWQSLAPPVHSSRKGGSAREAAAGRLWQRGLPGEVANLEEAAQQHAGHALGVVLADAGHEDGPVDAAQEARHVGVAEGGGRARSGVRG